MLQEAAKARRSDATPSLGVEAAPASGERAPLDFAAVRACRVNRAAAELRAATLVRRRSLKRRWQAGWLLRAVTLIDLTTLAGDDTPGRVARLCRKARRPIRPDVLEALGAPRVTAAAVCVHHALIGAARKALEGSGVPVAAVAAGFSSGLSSMETRVEEIRRSVEEGAEEIDVVITRGSALTGEWERLHDEVARFREACRNACMKVILGVGELGTLANAKRAATVAIAAGADFVKTSTGKEAVNATLPSGLVLARAVRERFKATGERVGLKAAGGIGRASDALAWLLLVREELGADWLEPKRFRLGASSLLADIERQLERHATGRYSAFHRHPLG